MDTTKMNNDEFLNGMEDQIGDMAETSLSDVEAVELDLSTAEKGSGAGAEMNSDPVAEPMPDLTGAVTEIVDGGAGEGTALVTATGDIEFTDADITDVHSVATAPVGGGIGFIGLFSSGLSDPSTGDGAGTVTWTFEINDADLEFLNDGEVIIQDYVITVDDGMGGSFSETVTITITGSADSADVSGDVSGVSTEDSGVTTTGNIDHVDPDNADPDDLWNTVVVTNGIYGTLTITADGAWEYTLDDANPTVDALAVGEPLVDTITVETGDGTQTNITINITGANDAPTVGAPITGGGTEDDGPLSFDLLAGAADVDATDMLEVSNLVLTGGDDSGVIINTDILDIDPNAYNYLAVGESAVIVYSYNIIDGNGGSVPQTATITITGENDVPTIAGAVTGGSTEDDAMFSVDMLDGASDADISDILNVDGMSLTLVSGDNGGIAINANSLDVDPSAYDYLAVGESAVIIYSYDIIDGNGGTVAQTATITITGENDAPTIGAAVTGGSTEDDAMFSVDMLDGAADVDATDVISVDAMSLMVTSGNDAGVTVNGDMLDVDPSAYNYLAVGESEVIVYSYNIIDGNGGVTPQTATITITGENDTPSVAAALTSTATEDDAVYNIDLLVGATDPDTSDTLNVGPASFVTLSGDDSGITVNGNTLDVDPDAYNALAVGESEIIVIRYNIVDGNGAGVVQTVTITITGENDAPIITGAVTGGSTEDDAMFSVDMLDGASDPDATDMINVDAMSVTLMSGDDSGITVNGNDLDVDPNAYNYLAVGESAIIVYSYDIIDGNGGVTPQTATITITGENDAPTVAAAVTGGSTEDDAMFSVDMLDGASDPDTSDTLNVDGTSLTLMSGDDSGVTINGNSLDVDPNAYNYLAVGESAIIVYSYDIIDGNGGTVAQTATITITGENDAPVITGAVTGGSTEDDAMFSVDMLDGASDPDTSDMISIDGMSVTLVSGNTAGVTVNGSDLDVDPSAYNYLAVGETEVIVYSYDIIDGNGGVTPQTATITITGENDAPTVTGGVSGGSTEDDMAFSIDLLANASDPDTTDTLNVGPASFVTLSGDDSGVTVNGNFLDVDPNAYNYLAVGETEVIVIRYNVVDGNGGGVVTTATITITGENDTPTISGAVTGGATEDDAMFSVDMLDGAVDPDTSDVLNVDAMSLMLVSGDDSGVTINGNSLDVDPSAYNYLAVGESAIIIYSYDIIDGNGGTVAQTATITITGENDAPTIMGAVTGGSTEDDAMFSVDMLTGASDPDMSDTINVDGTSLTLVSGNAAGVTVNGNDLDVDPNAYNYLAVGESAVIVYNYNIIDGNGGSVAQTATITITGENDAPTVAGAVTGGGTEDDALFSVDMLDGATDPDTSDVLNVDAMSLMLVSGDDSGITINGNSLDVDPNAYNYLAVGESAIIIYSYDIIDGNGGTVAQTATITITGENDAPTIAGAVTGGSTEDDALFSVDMLTGASDVDLSDTLNVDGPSITLVSGDDSGITVNGNDLDVDPNAYNYLAVGESAVIVYNYNIIDGNGGSVAQTATITITGENDAPTVAGAVTGGGTEDDALFSVDMLDGATDPDTSDVLNVDGMSLTLVSGDDSGVTINGNSLDVDPNAYNYLAVGESAIIIYSYDIIDGNGGTVAQTATITITGENDAPTVASAVTGGSTEDDAMFSVDMLDGASDVDLSDTLNVDAMSIMLVSGDDSGITVNGNDLDVDPNAYNYLAVGESAIVIYSYNIIDGNGGSVAQTATITITGENDAPVVAAALTTNNTEDDAMFSVDLLAGASDPDTSDTLNVGPASFVLLSGDASGVTINGNFLDVDPNAYNHLDDGESEVIVYQFNIVDGNGGGVVQTATITITGANDAPIIDLVNGLTGDVTEIADGAPGENVTVTQISATITFTDAEISDIHSAVITPTGPNVANYIGTFAGGITDTATGDGMGEFAWVFDINDADIDFLAAGEVLVQTYDVSIQDDGAIPLSDTETVTITITGTNDAPIITSGVQSAMFTENAGVTGDATAQTAMGQITFDDVDISDVDHTVDVSLAASGTTTGLPDAATLDSFLTLSGFAVGGGTGSVDWDFSAADQVFDYLAAGETVSLVYTVTFDDLDGGVASQDITIMVTGTNDAPMTVIDGGDSDTTIFDETDAGLLTNGTISVTDADISDEVFVTVDSVVESGTVSGIANGTLLAMLGVDLGAIIDNVSTEGDINWTFDSGLEAFDYLADGESLTLDYVLLVDDGNGGVTPQGVTIVINGTNDQPVITLGDDTGAVTEDAAMPNLTDAGSFTFADADDSDVLVASVAQEGAATTSGPSGIPAGLTAALAGAMGIVQTGANDGTIDWTFTLDNALTQYLGEGETVTVVYRVSIDDGSGTANAVQTQDITVTITGTNDVPVAVADVGAVNEDAVLMGDVSTNDSDADDSAVLTYTLDAPVAGLTLNADGTYTFDANDAAYQHLAGGVVDTIVANYTVTDDQGATAMATLTIDVTGMNDAPDVVAPLTSSASEDDTSFTFDLLTGASDVDDGDAISIANVMGLQAGVTLMGTIVSVDLSDIVFQSLDDGESLVIVITYDIEDLNGGVTPQTATITVNGANDAPVIGMISNSNVMENSANGTIVGTVAASDIDASDTVSYSLADDAGGRFAIDSVTGEITVADGLGLDFEQNTSHMITVAVSDGTDTVMQTFTITIDDQNSPEIVTADDIGRIIIGDDGNDILTGGLGDDQLIGGAGDDLIEGGGGMNMLSGEDGDDTFIGGPGQDAFDGGADFDIVDYMNAAVGVTLDMALGGSGGDATGDSYTGIEAIYGSAFDDVMAGDGLDNELRGQDGNDMLSGGGGKDLLIGGAGADSLDGGAGVDTASYADALSAVSLSLATGGTLGDALGDSYVSIEIVIGSDFDDNIDGGTGNDTLRGGDGNDRLNGNDGNDRLFGEDGNDIIDGGDGNDIISGGLGTDRFIGSSGADTYLGGAGVDTIDYRTSAVGVEFNLATGGVSGDAAGDSYIGVERALGSTFDDLITGASSSDNLHGWDGNDYLHGGSSGNDSLFGEAGVDSFGFDTGTGRRDIINDFEAGAANNEIVYILGGDANFDTFAEVMAVATDVGSDVVFDFGGGNRLTFIGLQAADFDISDFDFSNAPPMGPPPGNEGEDMAMDDMAVDDLAMLDMDALI